MSGIHSAAGRIWMTDATGAVSFDTDERCFIATDFVSGSFGPTSSYTATASRNSLGQLRNSYVDVSNTYTLASVHASADTVLGSFQVTASDSFGVANIGWFCAGGTYQHGVMPGLIIGSTTQVAVGGSTLYTFRASGGVLYLDQHVCLDAGTFVSPGTGTSTITHSALTFNYKFYVGTFN